MLVDKEKFNEYLLEFFKEDVNKMIINITMAYIELEDNFTEDEANEVLDNSKVRIYNENDDTIICCMDDPYIKITISNDGYDCIYSIVLRDQVHTILSFTTSEIHEFILYWNRFIIDHFNYGPKACLPEMHFNIRE